MNELKRLIEDDTQDKQAPGQPAEQAPELLDDYIVKEIDRFMNDCAEVIELGCDEVFD